MIKGVLKRISSLLLALVLVVGLMPLTAVPAMAAEILGLSDTEIGLGGDNRWSASGTTIWGSVSGNDGLGGCGSSSESITLTIQNKKRAAATLSFDYSKPDNGGSVTIDNQTYIESGSFSQELKANETIKITLTSPENSSTATITLSNLSLLTAGGFTVTFLPGDHGAYTVDAQSVSTDGLTFTQESSHKYSLHATPDSGYKFVGWKNSKNTIVSTAAQISIGFDYDTEITPWFVLEDTTIFFAEGDYYTDLNQAITAAQINSSGIVSVAMDGTLPAGEYTIPAGVTLLVPFDDANTVYKNQPANTGGGGTYTSPTKFRRLTMATGSHIVVEDGGAISVGSMHAGNHTFGEGAPSGPYGHIQMEEGSSITLQDGAALYAYGFITGSGSVEAQPGSEVWEYFQINDWRGGSAALDIKDNPYKAFLFSQYYVQNIEVPLTIHNGATETVYTTIVASSTAVSSSIEFVGDNGLFRLTGEGTYLRKQYLPDHDRLKIELSGTVSISNINVTVMGVSISSEDYVLPINSNVSMHILDGTTTMTQDISLLPGVELTIDGGAALEVQKNLFVYDREEWMEGNFVHSNAHFRPSKYVPDRTYMRTNNDLVDAVLNINGSVKVSGGLYTTKTGANLTSSEGTGRLILNTVPNQEQTLHEISSTSPVKYADIPITPAVLQNSNGTTTATAGATAGTAYVYVDGVDGQWLASGIYINSTGHKTQYKVGDELDVTDLTILVVSSDGSTETVKVTNDMVSGFNSSAVTSEDRQPLTITYEGKTTTYTISIGMSDGPEIAETLTGVKPSTPGGDDGKITGLSANKAYEYREASAEPEAEWSLVTADATEITGLSAGTYEVRYAQTTTHTAGPATEVTVPEGEATVTVVDGGKGASGSGSYVPGTTVTINAGTKDGCEFTSWTAEGITLTDSRASEITFTMPSNNVTLTATWHCHKDNVKLVSGKAATCTEAGTKAYYQCSCGKYFEDADCTTEIENIDTWKVIPALQHSYGAPVFAWATDYSSCTATFTCTRGCGHTGKPSVTVSSTTTDATCDTDGKTTYTAKVTFGGQECTDTEAVTIPSTGHNWKAPSFNWSADGSSCTVTFVCENNSEHTQKRTASITSAVKKEATCTETGVTTYTATVIFNEQTYTDSKDVADIPMKEHTPGSEWKADGDNHWKACTVCQTELEKSGHDFQWSVDTPATEDSPGIKHEECSVCGYKRNENTEIPQLEHAHTGITHHEAVPATCHSAGTTEYWTCYSDKCAGKYYGDAQCQTELTDIIVPIDPDNHDGATEVRDAKEATCTEDGYTGDIYCMGCGKMITSGTVIPATEHSWGDWQYNEEKHWKVCANCKDIAEEGIHIYDDGSDTTCNVCGYDRTESIRYTITFTANGGTGSMESQQVIGAQTIMLPDCSFTPPAGMQFKAWLVGETEYTPGSSLTVNGDTEIAAVWEPIPASSLTLSTDRASLTGSGTVTLTVTNLPAGQTVRVSCDDPAVVVTQQADGTWTASLPNVTKDYTFTATAYLNSTVTGTSDCTVQVTEKSSTGGGGGGGGSTSTPTYSVTADTPENGAVKVSEKSASYDETVTITVDPDEGYELDSLTVTDSNGNEIELTRVSDTEYTFTMPRSRVAIEAAFAEINHADVCPSADFTDVDMDAWYHDAVDYAIENGMMNGVGDNLFAPESNLTRAMLVQVLWNLEGNPDTSAITEYSDVASDAWYYNAVQWATAENIVGGYGNGIYGPEDDITREQMALMLYRYAQYKGYDTTQSGADVQNFTDYKDISDWALEGVTWAVNAGLLNGKGNGILDPTGDATRAEVAQILMNFCENIVE